MRSRTVWVTSHLPISRQLKFTSRRFFDAFMGREGELASLFTAFDRNPPDPLTVESACEVADSGFPGRHARAN
ncbi:hypothetical protein [Haloferula sp. A504]|uniref:hypothetical protein n=1 Tax=Haloferula sp. A504 TaxID=3373601 RepID=UPI0031BF2E78|nr:hypothetical protein [Verrucomicrobiaceae bacterium E54]